MSNIRGFHNLDRSQDLENGRNGIQNGNGITYQPASRGFFSPPPGADANKTGISLFTPLPNEDGSPIDWKDRLFPNRSRWTATFVLTVLDLLLFVITLIVGIAKFGGIFDEQNDMIGPNGRTLIYMGAKFTPYIQDGEVWRLVTSMFLHAGFLHIAGNLYFQCRLGFTLEKRWTISRFLMVYFLTGLGGSLFSAVLSPETVSVGASGALFGLVGADLTYIVLNRAEIPQFRMECCMLVVVTVINLIMGIGTTVDNNAHLGGLVTGLLCAPAFIPMLVPYNKERLVRLASGVLSAGLVVLMSALLWS